MLFAKVTKASKTLFRVRGGLVMLLLLCGKCWAKDSRLLTSGSNGASCICTISDVPDVSNKEATARYVVLAAYLIGLPPFLIPFATLVGWFILWNGAYSPRFLRILLEANRFHLGTSIPLLTVPVTIPQALPICTVRFWMRRLQTSLKIPWFP